MTAVPDDARVDDLGPSTIVVGVDASIDSAEALWHARTIAEASSSDLVVVYVHSTPAWDALAMVSEGAGALLFAVAEQEVAVHERVSSCLEGFHGCWHWEIREGDTARQLADAANHHDADLIVVGAGDRSRGNRSVASRLMRYTTRSLLMCGRR